MACHKVLILLMYSACGKTGTIEIILDGGCEPEAYRFDENGDKTILCGLSVHRPVSWPQIDRDDLPAIVSRLLLLASLDPGGPDLEDDSGYTKHQLGLTTKCGHEVLRYSISIEHWFPSFEEIVVQAEKAMRDLDPTVELIHKDLPQIESKVEDLPRERILVKLSLIGKEGKEGMDDAPVKTGKK
jgi:hypothetical protein